MEFESPKMCTQFYIFIGLGILSIKTRQKPRNYEHTNGTVIFLCLFIVHSDLNMSYSLHTVLYQG